MENVMTYEEQKQSVLQIAEDKFGKYYFQQLDQLIADFAKEEESPSYTVIVNYKGAFNACEE
ncbi:MAG: hypothetical protein WCO02_03665 [Bacteroidota bacterium]